MNLLQTQFPATNFTVLAIVLALPALGALVNGIFGKRLGKEGVRLMALSAIGGSFVASLVAFLSVPAGGGKLSWTAWEWLSFPARGGQNLTIDIKFSVDAMTATMMLVVTGVGFLIHLYSTEYMKNDAGYWRFFSYLNLFCFSMLLLIMGDNLPILFVGWEGVGLCSYLLIGFWFDDEANASAGKKAFIANRVGDFGLLLAMAMLIYFVGALDWTGLESNSGSLMTQVQVWPIGNLPTEAEWDTVYAAQSAWPSGLVHVFLPEEKSYAFASTLVCLALFLGCAGKSAQIPLYVWLPDAMAGPTPVSALIHAATMVTAGVYLIARTSYLFVLSPAAMATVAVIGALTAVFAATIGLLQNDLKKVLAYSTVSQLGYMFMGVGVGAFSAGFFHVFTHAFFKACLFLGAGSVIHAMHARVHDTAASQDMRNMGGLGKYMPKTRATFLVSCLSIAGAPLLAGFWSKDEILWKAFSVDIVKAPRAANADLWMWPSWLGPAIYVAGVLGAVMTAFYMFRAYFMTFEGKFRGWKIVRGWKPAGDGHDDHHDDHHHAMPTDGPKPKESPAAMTVPLMVLGFMAVFAGWLGAEPLAHIFHIEGTGKIAITSLLHLIEPAFIHADAVVKTREGVDHLAGAMMLPGVAAFVIGLGGAWYVYGQHAGQPEKAFSRSFPRLHSLIYDKWRIDELYDATVIGMVDALADIFTMADRWIVDGIIARLTATVVKVIGGLLRLFQTGRVQVYAAGMVIGLFATGWFFLQPHAEARVDATKAEATGVFEVAAAPGLGYSYRWEAEGVKEQEEFKKTDKLWVTVEAGKSKEVKLFVRNAIGSVDETTITLTRKPPKNAGGTGVAVQPAAGTPQPIRARPVQPPGVPGQAAPAPNPGLRPSPNRPRPGQPGPAGGAQ